MQITYFECKRRIERLSLFREFLTELPHRFHQIPPELREAINRAQPAVGSYMHDVESYPAVLIREAPVSGGTIFPSVDALRNLFIEEHYHEMRQIILDSIDRSIGSYELDLGPSRIRTFNPFWWVWLAIVWLSATPFRLLSLAGFDAEAVESSLLGKVTKLLVALAGIAGFFAAVLVIFDSPTFRKVLAFLTQ